MLKVLGENGYLDEKLVKDLRNALKSILFRDKKALHKIFIYLDPPYLETRNNYIIENKNCKWTKKDVDNLFEIAVNSEIKFAMSEFDNEYILQKAKEYNLNVIEIGERRNMKNRRTEILITNYDIREDNLF